MELSFIPYRIQCRHPFGIARSTHEYYDVVYVYLQENGFVGRGEAAPASRYSETIELVLSRLENCPTYFDDISNPESGLDKLVPFAGGMKSLEAAFSMAVFDIWTQKQKLPLYSYFGVEAAVAPVTSFTIAIGELDSIPEKIKEAEPYAILKIKLGTKNDKEIIDTVRDCTEKPVRVDANEGWDLQTAMEMCEWLADKNIEFVEQPLPADQLDKTAILRSSSPIPIFADENCMTSQDIPTIAHAFHGINIKLMKCGCLLEAKRMIETARKHDLQIMLGCMVESSVGITAAAHLSPLVDYADLDGNLLIDNDPYTGVSVINGQIVLPKGNGLGVEVKNVSGLK